MGAGNRISVSHRVIVNWNRNGVIGKPDLGRQYLSDIISTTCQYLLAVHPDKSPSLFWQFVQPLSYALFASGEWPFLEGY